MEKQVEDSIEDLSRKTAYKNSRLVQKLKSQIKNKQNNIAPIAFFSDIDDTLRYIPKNHTDKDKAYYEGLLDRIVLRLEKANIPMIAVTSRCFTDVLNGQKNGTYYEQQHLPTFDVIVSSLGTHVAVLQNDYTYMVDTDFQDSFLSPTKFDRLTVVDICSHIMAANTNQLLAFQSSRDGIVAGANLQTSPYKVSLSYEGPLESLIAIKSKIAEELAKNGHETSKIIITSASDVSQSKHCFDIDIVPVTKQEAIYCLIHQYGCYSIFGGDSVVDLDAILNSTDAGFIVGNRKKELDYKIKELINATRVVKKSNNYVLLQLAKKKNLFSPSRVLFIDMDSNRNGPESVYLALEELISNIKLLS